MRKEEESRKSTKVLFRLLNGVQMRGENARWLGVACRISHLLSILAYLVMSALGMLASLQAQSSILGIIRFVLAVISIVSVFGMATVFCVEYRFFNEMGALQQHKGILKVNGVVASVLYYTIELIYFQGSILFFESLVLLDSFSPQDYILIVFGSIVFVTQSLLVLTNRLFGRAAVLVGPMLALAGSVLGTILLFLLAGLLLYKENPQSTGDHHMQRVLYLLVAVTCIWSYLQIQYASIQQNMVAFLNLIFLGTGILGVYFFYPTLFGSRTALEDSRLLLQWYKERAAGDGQGDEGDVNLEEEQLYQRHFQEVEQQDMVCYPIGSRGSSVAGWKESEKARMLWQRISWTRENDNSFQMSLFYFRAGFSLKTNFTILLKEMASFLDKNKSIGLLRKYQIFKLNQQVFNYYEQASGANDLALQIADVVEAEHHYHHFYQQLDQLLAELVEFWKEIVANDFSINADIEYRINVVSQLQRNAKRSLQKLSSYRITQQEKLFAMVSQLINCYQPTVGQGSASGPKSQTLGSFEYVVLEGDLIRKISLRLLKSLGYEPDSTQVHSMRTLLPVNFFGYLQEVQRKFLEREQIKEFAIPVVDASGCIVLRQCLLYVVPHWSCALQYLLSFQSLEVPNQTFLLYNANKQKVEHFSAGFREFIGMKLDSFNEFQSGENVLFSSDIFQSELGSAELQILRAHEIIKTKIIYPDFYLRKNSLYNYNDEVTLHLQHEFSFTGQNYLLLNVQSESYRQAKMEVEQKSQSHIRGINRQKQLHEEYAHEQFFCRIENPYKSKIVQKLNGIRTRTYKSYFFQILAIKLGLLLLLLVNTIVFKVLSQQMMTKGLNFTTIMYNLNNEYIYLLRLFSGTYSNFLFVDSPDITANYLNSTFFNGTATNKTLINAASNLTAFYQSFNDKNSQTLMSTYLLYKPGVAAHLQMDYNLAFSEFNITTNTMLTSFYDFIVEVEQGFTDGSAIPFLAQNYDSVMEIMPVYEQSDAFLADYIAQYQFLQVLGYVFIIVLTVAIIISFASTAKMIDIHEQMHLLYRFVDRSDVRKIIKELTVIQDAIGTIANENGMQKAFDQVITRRSLFDSHQEISESHRELEAEQNGNMNESGKKRPHEKQTCLKAVYKAFKYIYFCPILFATTWMIIYLEYSNMKTDQSEFSQAITLLQKLQSDQMHIEKFYSDLFQPNLYQLHFGPYTYSAIHTVLKNQFFSDELPTVFANDVFYDENLCQQLYISPITIPYFTKNASDCSNMELGILTKGYSAGLEFYQSYLREQSRLNFTQYLSTAGYSKIREIIFLKELLFSYLKIKKTNFMRNYSTYLDLSQSSDYNILVFTLAICLSLLVILVFNVVTLRKKMYSVIELICAIPSSAMYKMTMTNYIRKEGILAKMDQL